MTGDADLEPLATAGIRVAVESPDRARRRALAAALTAYGLELAAGPDLDADVLVLDAPDGRAEPLPALDRCPVVVVADLDAAAAAALLRAGGPLGLLPAAAADQEIAAAVVAVAHGLSVFAPEYLPPPRTRHDTDEPETPLTAREMHVLELLAAGHPNKTIARQLAISENTVKFHVAAILSKLDAQSRAEAAMIAARRGLVPL